MEWGIERKKNNTVRQVQVTLQLRPLSRDRQWLMHT